jgi:hypothetical protein
VIREGWNRIFGAGASLAGDIPAGTSPAAREALPMKEFSRHSSALEQFFQALDGQLGLQILDLGVSNQDNTDFFNDLGHRVKYDNFVRSLDESLGSESPEIPAEERMEQFQSKVLNFDNDSLDGILAWDSLQYLPLALLDAAVSQMHAILHRGGQLVTVFHSDEKAGEVPFYSYRIQDRSRVKLVERARRKPAQYFTTRSLERLFRQFDQVKFFLTQDALREVIARK